MKTTQVKKERRKNFSGKLYLDGWYIVWPTSNNYYYYSITFKNTQKVRPMIYRGTYMLGWTFTFATTVGSTRSISSNSKFKSSWLHAIYYNNLNILDLGKMILHPSMIKCLIFDCHEFYKIVWLYKAKWIDKVSGI